MDRLNFVEFAAKLGIFYVPFLFALCFHEFAHGLVAKWRGDRTAEMSGRLTLNPMAHADLLGTWILPIAAILFQSPFFFGWAKPVPVNSRNLRRPLQDMFWISLAGPASNVFLALLGTLLLGLVYAFLRGTGLEAALTELLKVFIMVNLFLAFFNLIPVHPLDGAKVMEPFLPLRWNMWLDQNQGTLNMGLMLMIFLFGPILSMPVTWIWHHLLYASVLIGSALT